MSEQQTGLKIGVVLLALVALHFVVRSFFANERIAPDLMLLAMMFYAIRSRPGNAAIVGFAVGILADALSPVAFGASAFAHTVVAYLQAWGKAIFFPDNLLVTGGFLLLGGWTRNLLVLLAGGQITGVALLTVLVTSSLIQALLTTATGVAVLLLFRRWFRIEIVQ